MDSIRVRFKTPIITNTQTITVEKTVYKKKHWNVSPQVGVGYGFINRKPDVYVGFGISYNF